MSLTSWLVHSDHREWLRHNLTQVLTFALPAIRSDGGFHYQGADGAPLPGRPPQLFLTARMAATAAQGVARGIPGSGELLDHAMASLRGFHVDREHGGWLTQPGTTTRKSAYDHVHVGLAAARAHAIGHPDAAELIAQVREVVDAHFWQDATGTIAESFAADWTDQEAYYGANAHMHTVEAFLELGWATGAAEWHQRALRIAERVINQAARQQHWLIPEHFSSNWDVLLEYNADEPMHPFRPFGATPGHALEWTRFLLDLERSPMVSADWLTEAADALTRRALDGCWALDGRPGLVYTTDWDGRPVATARLHWPVCEGIQAAAGLRAVTGDEHWEQWYRRLWDHAARYFIDERGAWRNELAEDLTEGGDLWPGRPDVYHCGGALAGSLEVGDRMRASSSS